ncbi:MAG: pyridoxal-phosphate dependent enzyme, partial [Alphaproteobacteria bacterium]|nr:pyridoxal-phosphate dependent enzyme [Alphaproteobacteria bacterium]
MDNFNIEHLSAVRNVLSGRVKRTPVLALNGSKIAPLIPQNTEMFIKLELFQHTGSFKARGALLGVDWLTPAERERGIATFSGGNHALAVTWASCQCGISAKVIMPKFADPIRIEGCRDMGAEVILTDDIASAATLLKKISETENRKILHPFNDLNMAFGA